jgi:hypothetical protein
LKNREPAKQSEESWATKVAEGGSQGAYRAYTLHERRLESNGSSGKGQQTDSFGMDTDHDSWYVAVNGFTLGTSPNHECVLRAEFLYNVCTTEPVLWPF